MTINTPKKRIQIVHNVGYKSSIYTEENKKLLDILSAEYPEQLHKVLSSENCDISPDFLGYLAPYSQLSKIIPSHWTVLDLGCSWAPQAYYFNLHYSYIGVDNNCKVEDRFTFENTHHLNMSIEEFLSLYDLESPVFCICSYVNAVEGTLSSIRLRLLNLFMYYPRVVTTPIWGKYGI